MAHLQNWQMPSKSWLLAAFTPGLAQDIWTSKFDPQETNFETVVMQNARMYTAYTLQEVPTDLRNFCNVLDFILSENAKQTIRFNCQIFDNLAGVAVAEDFLSHRSFEHWLASLAGCLITISALPTHTISSTASSSRPSAVFSATTSLSSNTTGPNALDSCFDGTSEGNSGKVIQINLEGPTIRQAWASNTTIVNSLYGTTLRKLEDWAPKSDYVPKDPGAYSVYHGTAAHFQYSRWPETWNAAKLDLATDQRCGQMSPKGIGGVYTAFSAMRAFLWAAFQEHIYTNIPAPKDIDWMSKSWTSEGRVFAGVAVFMFDVVQPKPARPSMSACIIPTGKEQAWHNKVVEMSSRSWHSETDRAWQSMLPLLGSSDLKNWPEVLHSMEFGHQRASLVPFRTNMWRTCWSGQGVDAINGAYRNTFAITFTKTTPPPAPKATIVAPLATRRDQDEDKDKDKDKGKGKGKDRLKTLSKRISGLLGGKDIGKSKK